MRSQEQFCDLWASSARRLRPGGLSTPAVSLVSRFSAMREHLPIAEAVLTQACSRLQAPWHLALTWRYSYPIPIIWYLPGLNGRALLLNNLPAHLHIISCHLWELTGRLDVIESRLMLLRDVFSVQRVVEEHAEDIQFCEALWHLRVEELTQHETRIVSMLYALADRSAVSDLYYDLNCCLIAWHDLSGLCKMLSMQPGRYNPMLNFANVQRTLRFLAGFQRSFLVGRQNFKIFISRQLLDGPFVTWVESVPEANRAAVIARMARLNGMALRVSTLSVVNSASPSHTLACWRSLTERLNALTATPSRNGVSQAPPRLYLEAGGHHAVAPHATADAVSSTVSQQPTDGMRPRRRHTEPEHLDV
ncbi:hypothetical protein BDZ89DRAFT_1067323 [Hymenopellis radicata]|nr:hypothetical protein BDZ89DRAFT_1067323 [Hymenopellis radicata]